MGKGISFAQNFLSPGYYSPTHITDVILNYLQYCRETVSLAKY
jgi:hypothetical protein